VVCPDVLLHEIGTSRSPRRPADGRKTARSVSFPTIRLQTHRNRQGCRGGRSGNVVTVHLGLAIAMADKGRRSRAHEAPALDGAHSLTSGRNGTGVWKVMVITSTAEDDTLASVRRYVSRRIFGRRKLAPELAPDGKGAAGFRRDGSPVKGWGGNASVVIPTLVSHVRLY
jgi:hypothetical protein